MVWVVLRYSLDKPEGKIDKASFFSIRLDIVIEIVIFNNCTLKRGLGSPSAVGGKCRSCWVLPSFTSDRQKELTLCISYPQHTP